jgi:hypothetical protein
MNFGMSSLLVTKPMSITSILARYLTARFLWGFATSRHTYLYAGIVDSLASSQIPGAQSMNSFRARIFRRARSYRLDRVIL